MGHERRRALLEQPARYFYGILLPHEDISLRPLSQFAKRLLDVAASQRDRHPRREQYRLYERDRSQSSAKVLPESVHPQGSQHVPEHPGAINQRAHLEMDKGRKARRRDEVPRAGLKPDDVTDGVRGSLPRDPRGVLQILPPDDAGFPFPTDQPPGYGVVEGCEGEKGGPDSADEGRAPV